MFRVSRGFTVMELLVASGITLLFFIILVQLLLRASGAVHRTATLSELQQSAELIYTRIASYAHRCDDGGATYLTDTDLVALSLHPVQDVSPSARKLYAAQVTAFCWTPARLTLTEQHGLNIPEEDRYQPRKLGPDAIRQLSLEPPRRVLSRHMGQFSVTSADGNFPVLLTMKLARNAPGAGVQSVALERYLVLRNLF